MPFRENDEATRARADALAEKVEELEKERAQLLAEKKRHDAEDEERRKKERAESLLAAPRGPSKDAPKNARKNTSKNATRVADLTPPDLVTPPEPRAIRAAASVGKVAWVLVPVLVIAGIAAVAISHDREVAEARREWDAKIVARDAMRSQWESVVNTEPCLRATELGTADRRAEANRMIASPRAQFNSSAFSVGAAVCRGAIAQSITPTSTAPDVKAAVQKWITSDATVAAIEKRILAYYGGRDFQEDDYAAAPSLWKGLLSSLDARQAALADVRKIAFPVWRAFIHDRQDAEDRARPHSELWWRVEIGLAIWDIEEIAFRTSGISDGKKPDFNAAATAIHDPLAAMLEHAKVAPIDVRRELRKYDYVVTPILAGTLAPDGLFNLESGLDFLPWIQSKVPGPLPDPGPRPRR